jgi:hypothetical protein
MLGIQINYYHKVRYQTPSYQMQMLMVQDKHEQEWMILVFELKWFFAVHFSYKNLSKFPCGAKLNRLQFLKQ